MRTHQRLSAPNLLTLAPLESLQHRRRRAPPPHGGPLTDLDLGARPCQPRVPARELGLQRGPRFPSTAEQVHADRRELLVPRPEPRRQPGIDRPLLQEPVAARQNLTEADERRRVIGVEPGSEPIDEVTAGRRAPALGLLILAPPPRCHPP